MRAIAAVTLMAAFLPILAVGQMAQKASTFTNPDGAFRFVYPADFQVCARGKIDPCNRSFIPTCESDALVCVVYPAEEFNDTNFGTEAFQVREILTTDEMMTADVCVTPYPPKNGDTVSPWPEFLISAKRAQRSLIRQ